MYLKKLEFINSKKYNEKYLQFAKNINSLENQRIKEKNR